MIEIRKAVSTYLETLHTKIYFQVAPENAEFPYIVYDLPNIIPDGEGGEIVTLDIDGWDCNDTGDTTVIENLMGTVNGGLDVNGNPTGLDKQTLSTDKIIITFFLDNKMALTDNKTIKRRKYIYTGILN